MNPVKAIKLFALYEKLQGIVKEKAPMKVKVPQFVTLLVSLSATIGLPTMLTDFVHAHPSFYLVVVAALIVLHALLPSMVAAPSGADKKAVGLNSLGIVVLLMGLTAICSRPVCAQATDQPLQNIYAAGLSYGVNGSPAIAGTALYAHLLNGSGTYAFTAVDALPATVKPFTVTSNAGIGVGQKVYTLGKIPIYMPTAAGVSWTGSHTGWQWNGGVLASIKLKNGYYLMPSVRFLKSSVSSGSGYQPIVGVLFGWGK